jgi:DNA-binding transcriptional regulator YiaG
MHKSAIGVNHKLYNVNMNTKQTTLTKEDLHAARQWVGETQKEFAKRVGVLPGTYAAWEHRGPPTQGGGRVLLERAIRRIERG